MKEKNPFKHIMFFSKCHNDDEEPKLRRVELADVSSFLPEKFQEKVVRFYYKTTEKQVTSDEAKMFVHIASIFSLLNIFIVYSWFDEWAKDYKKQLQSKKVIIIMCVLIHIGQVDPQPMHMYTRRQEWKGSITWYTKVKTQAYLLIPGQLKRSIPSLN